MADALRKAEHAKETGDEKAAVAIVRAFHRQLCATRVLDPACGTGNFLYVSLELMKKLEGEVLETLAQLGEPESIGLDRETVDPHQFLGLETQPARCRHRRTRACGSAISNGTTAPAPATPPSRSCAPSRTSISGERQGYDAVLTWDGYPHDARWWRRTARRVETYPNARRPEWPEAEFIVGNPPFIGGKDLRARLASATRGALGRAPADER